MGHHHTTNYGKYFAIGIGLNIIYVLVEAFYGIIINSSALLADAGHNAGDVLSLVFAWLAIWLSKKKPSGQFTFGFKKSTILISLLNALLLFTAVILIGMDALEKFNEPQAIPGDQVMIVAAIGVVINTFTALLFMKGRKGDLNIKGAFLHMTADAAVSLGVVLSGFFMMQTGLQWIDPLMSLLIIGVIVWSSWGLFKDSLKLALDAAPKSLKVDEVVAFLLDQPGIYAIHALHVWAISTTEQALSVHVVTSDGRNLTRPLLLQQELAKRFALHYTAIQVEEAEEARHCEMQ